MYSKVNNIITEFSAAEMIYEMIITSRYSWIILKLTCIEIRVTVNLSDQVEYTYEEYLLYEPVFSQS